MKKINMKYTNTNMNIDMEPININPKKWGPKFWGLLHVIAQYSDHIPQSYNQILKSLILTIPYILPCTDCSNHCRNIYSKLRLGETVSVKTFKNWVWILKSEVNRNTNSPNISYEDYKFKLQSIPAKEFISTSELISLLVMISHNYPYRNDTFKKNQVYLFISNLSQLASFIPQLKGFTSFVPTNIWNNKLEFQEWLRSKSKYAFNYHIDFNKHY